MQSVQNLVDVAVRSEKVVRRENFRMTSRDLDILEFILEMKFSTIEDIHSNFFKFTKDGEQSSCLRWARERVANLVKSEFLKVVKDVCYQTLYIVTQKGYFYLRNSRTDRTYPRPISDVDGRYYDHDQKVIQIRTVLQQSEIALHWISERQLTESDEYSKLLSTEFRPDGIYKTPEGKKVAFELEIARKSKERYQQKIKKFIQVISEGGDSPIFHQVHYVCEKEVILNLIREQVALYQPYFQFSLLSEILK